MKRLMVIFLLVSLFPVATVLAQSGEAANNLLNGIVALLLGTVFNGALALAFTDLGKRLPFLAAIPGEWINAVVVAVLAAVTLGTNFLGLGAQWQAVYALLGSVLPPILAVLLPLVGSQAAFRVAKANHHPWLGYSRTP